MTGATHSASGQSLNGKALRLLLGAVALLFLCGAAAGAENLSTPGVALTLSDPRLRESSGLAQSRISAHRLWTMNDSGSGPYLYAVSRKTGKTEGQLRLLDADRKNSELDVRDVEALAIGPGPGGGSALWLGDIGDNSVIRESVVLRTLSEPDTVRASGQTVPVRSLRVRYPNGPADAEALAWTPGGRLLIITKGLLSAQVYEVPPSAVRQALAGKSVLSPVLAQQVGTIDQGLLTDATALPDGRIVVRDYSRALELKFTRDLPGNTDLKIGVTHELPRQLQGESMAAEPGGRTVLVGSEGVNQPLWRITMSLPKPPTPLPLGLGPRFGPPWLWQLGAASLGVVFLLSLLQLRQKRRRRAVRAANRAAQRGSPGKW